MTRFRSEEEQFNFKILSASKPLVHSQHILNVSAKIYVVTIYTWSFRMNSIHIQSTIWDIEIPEQDS